MGVSKRSSQLRTETVRSSGISQRQRSLLNYGALVLALGWLLLVRTTLNLAIDDAENYWQGAVNLFQTGDPYVARAANSATQTATSSIFGRPRLYLYPPTFVYLVQPIGLLSHAAAQQVWFGVNLACFAGFVSVCLWAVPSHSARQFWGVVALAAAFVPPTRLTFQLGQTSLFVALLLVGSFACARRNTVGAGGMLALVSLCKIYPAMSGLYYLFNQQRRVVAWGMALGTALIALPMLIYGAGHYRSFLTYVVFGSPYPLAAEHNISLAGFFSRLLTQSAYSHPLANAPLLAQGLTIFTSLGVLVLCVWAGRGALEPAILPIRFGLWLCGMLLITPANGYYNLVVLLFPLLAIMRVLEEQPNRSARAWLIIGTALCCIPPGWTNEMPALRNALHNNWGLLLLSPPLYGLLIYLWLLTRVGREVVIKPCL